MSRLQKNDVRYINHQWFDIKPLLNNANFDVSLMFLNLKKMKLAY